jgi:hypothetical protein
MQRSTVVALDWMAIWFWKDLRMGKWGIESKVGRSAFEVQMGFRWGSDGVQMGSDESVALRDYAYQW